MIDVLARLRRHYVPDVATGCWRWIGAKTANGYGISCIQGRRMVAHRAMHLAAIGPIPEGFEVDHLCRVRDCVNPRHLEAITPRENRRRTNPRMGSLLSIRGRLYIQVKDLRGRWRQRALGLEDTAPNRAHGERLLDEVIAGLEKMRGASSQTSSC